jgi:membrane associated rhomboid family serine protease
MPPVELSITLIIIAITALVSIGAFGDQKLFSDLLFEPFVIKARRQWYRFFTHAFVHANWPHLIVNMFVLYMFGRNVEFLYAIMLQANPLLPFLGLYLGGVLFSSIPGFRRHVLDPSYRAVGASGAVSAVLFAQVLMMPTRKVSLLFLPDMPNFVFGLLYLVYSYAMDKRGGDNVAHDAHFYGAVWGILFTAFLQPDLVFQFASFQRTLGL